MNNSRIDESNAAALRRFKDGPNVADRAAAITELLTRRALSSVVRTADFEEGLNLLVADMRTQSNAATKLVALAQLGRIEQSSKSIASTVRKLTVTALEGPPGPSSLLSDAEDRYYVAKACSWVTSPWVLPYAINAVAEEVPNADKVRGELFRLVFRDATSLADIFTRLRDALLETKPRTESPGNTLARRQTKILSALRDPIATSVLPPGEEVGKRLAEMVSVPLSDVGLLTDDEARIALAREIVLCTYDIVRTRISVFADADTYAAVRFARRLFKGSSWPSELADALSHISAALLEAILLMGKQGIPSRQLGDYLELVCGYPREAERRLSALADEHPELPEAVRAWLRKEPISRSAPSPTLVESDLLRADASVGEALVESHRLRLLMTEMSSNVVPALELYDPSKVEAVSSFLAQAKRVVEDLEEIARRRNLLLYGMVGEIMQFAPKYFDSAAGGVGREVRVIRPAVVRATGDGSPGEVVMRGIVE